MRSPIPEPGAYDPSRAPSQPALIRGPRPPLLNVLIAVQVILDLARPFLTHGKVPANHGLISFVGPLLAWFIYYLLWRGYNWVRILTLVGSFLGMIGAVIQLARIIPTPGTHAPLALSVLDIVLACLWIYLLRSRPAIEFTKGRSSETPSELSPPRTQPLAQPTLIRGPRPPWLIVLCAFETAVTFAEFARGLTAIQIALSACWLAVVYCLWRGRNWARIVVLISSVLTVLNFPTLFTKISPLTFVTEAVNIATSIGWLCMLPRGETVAFTKGLS